MEHGNGSDEMILVPRAELLAWAKAWQDEYGPNDGADCVTPFDAYLLKPPVNAQSTVHVEVLRHMKGTIKAIMPSEVAALDAAIASLSAPQPPAEAQPVDGFRGLDSTGRPLYGPQTPVAVITSPGTAPPSAPVGVEAAEHANVLRDLLADEYSEREDDGSPSFTLERAALQAAIDALAQQPAAVGEEIMVNAAHDVYTLPLQPSGLLSGPRFVVHVPAPEQPAAVDGWRLVVHQSERDTKPAVWATDGDSFVWVADLAAQQGGSDNDH